MNLKSTTETSGVRLQPTTALLNVTNQSLKPLGAKTDSPLCHLCTRAAWQCCPGLISQWNPVLIATLVKYDHVDGSASYEASPGNETGRCGEPCDRIPHRAAPLSEML